MEANRRRSENHGFVQPVGSGTLHHVLRKRGDNFSPRSAASSSIMKNRERDQGAQRRSGAESDEAKLIADVDRYWEQVFPNQDPH